MIKFNILARSAFPRRVAVFAALMGVFLAAGIFFQPISIAAIGAEGTDIKKEIPVSTEPRIVAAMKTSMYDQVADDEDIDIMAKWIGDGAKNDEFFNKKVYKILKNDCVNCHSTASTMTRKAPHIPFASYEDVKKFTKVGPTDASCLECHGNPVLQKPPDEKLKALFIDQTKFEMTVHQKLPCIRCHVVLHPETEKVYQDTKTFEAYVLRGERAAEPDSSQIFKPNCANCHPKEGQKLAESSHSAKKLELKLAQSDQSAQMVGKNQKELKAPQCNSCHGSEQHYITDTKLNQTKFDVVNRCGECHAKLTKTYFASYHGKAAKLGGEKVAKCVNCHGSHDLLSPSIPASMLSDKNILKTCQECHPKANKSFTGFLPHADNQDRENNPLLFYSFWIMTLLIVMTFALFGTHSFLWLNRSMIERFSARKNREKMGVPDDTSNRHIRRFSPSHSILHLMIMVSFLTLALREWH